MSNCQRWSARTARHSLTSRESACSTPRRRRSRPWPARQHRPVSTLSAPSARSRFPRPWKILEQWPRLAGGPPSRTAPAAGRNGGPGPLAGPVPFPAEARPARSHRLWGRAKSRFLLKIGLFRYNSLLYRGLCPIIPDRFICTVQQPTADLSAKVNRIYGF